MRLSTAIRRFDTQLKADGKSQHTRSAYVRDLSDLRAWLRKDTDIRVITANKLAKYLASEDSTARLGKAGNKRHLTVHCTRHAFAMNVCCKTGDLRLVQTALGQRHISTTEIYARLEYKVLRRALERL
jgi:site-specific recombinase XerD